MMLELLEDLTADTLESVLSNREVLDKIPTDMLVTMYKIGQWNSRTREFLEDHHTCTHREYRQIWPPELGCRGCDYTLVKYAKMFHLELPLLLYGRDMVIDEITRQFEMKEEQARIRRSLGSGI
jgi:hypothetical protein